MWEMRGWLRVGKGRRVMGGKKGWVKEGIMDGKMGED